MNDTPDFATLLAPLWKRKWLIFAVAAIVAAGTYYYYHRQTKVYSATTQLDLGAGMEARQLANGAQSRATLNSRSLADAAALIESSSVTESVRQRLRHEGVPPGRVGKVRAKAAAESYIVTITAEAHSPKQASRLANDYALVYIERQHLRYQSEVQAAIASTRRQLHRIEAAQAAQSARATGSSKGSSHSPGFGGSAVIQAAALASKINQLEADLSVASVQQISVARPSDAQLVAPIPVRNAIFGLVLGLLLGCVAVLALDGIDRRIRSLGQLRETFKARILAALPRERAPLDYRDGQPRPAESLLEPLRRLHTEIRLGDMLDPAAGGRPRVILFLSPESGDGKSTLVASLALTQRDMGARVAVIEADLRRPALARLLSVDSAVGLVEVLDGDVGFEQAGQSVGAVAFRREAGSPDVSGGVSTAVRAGSTGSLTALVGGRPVANPPALLASESMRSLLASAAADHDFVLIDAPPPLQVSDAMPLLHWVDGIVVVARLDHTSQASARHLARLLVDSSTAPVLGIVANGVSPAEIKRGGFASSYGEQRWPHNG